MVLKGVVNVMWINEFFDLFYSGDVENRKKARNLKDCNMPKSLYKYTSIKENGHTFDLLKNDLVFLSNANNLNDLYEGEFFYDDQELFHNKSVLGILDNFIKRSKMTHEEKEKLINSKEPFLDLMKFVYETDSSVSKDMSFDEFYDFTSNMVFDLNRSFYQRTNNNRKENTYLTCFSEKYDLILMWSYYTNSNKGICIKYNIDDCKNFIRNSCYPIKYEDGYDYTKELCDMKKYAFKLNYDPYLKKEKIWQHEKEWRILFNMDLLLSATIKSNGKHFLKLPKPSAVYLGKRISSENEEKIKDICKNREISLYKMEKNTKKASLYETEILKFSEKNWEDKLFIIESIRNRTCKSLIRNYFFYSRCIEDMERGFLRIIDSFNDLTDRDIQFFLNELLLKNDIFPVLCPFYSNVLAFLIKLYDDGSFNNIKTNDGMSIEKNLEKWVGYCISGFSNKKLVRYMIFFERLLMRFYNRYVILSYDERDIYEKMLPNFSFKNEYVAVIEEDIIEDGILMHPFTNGDMVELIGNDILDNLKIIIRSFYKNKNFDEKACHFKYLRLKSVVERIENDTELYYEQIFANSKRYLQIDYLNFFNEYYDILLERVCGILIREKHILNLLSSEDRYLFEILGRINYTQRFSSFISECCDELNIDYKCLININKEFFNPKINLYTFFN